MGKLPFNTVILSVIPSRFENEVSLWSEVKETHIREIFQPLLMNKSLRIIEDPTPLEDPCISPMHRINSKFRIVAEWESDFNVVSSLCSQLQNQYASCVIKLRRWQASKYLKSCKTVNLVSGKMFNSVIGIWIWKCLQSIFRFWSNIFVL